MSMKSPAINIIPVQVKADQAQRHAGDQGDERRFARRTLPKHAQQKTAVIGGAT